MNLFKRLLPTNLFGNVNMKISRNNSTSSCQRLKGKVAIVTASTEGIGLAIAQRLGAEGANVVISSRKIENVSKALKQLKDDGLNVHGIKCHVGSKEDRKNLFKETITKFDGLDILVSNAAVNPVFGPMLDCSEEAWDKIFDINVKCSFLLAKEAVPLMRQRDGGNIVFISSIAGMNIFPFLGAYSVSKTALFGLTKALSSEMALENIRVNCVAPGVIETKFSQALTGSKTAEETSLSKIPLGRVGQTSEISGLVAFLVSDDGSYITGETIVAAGGMQSRL